MMENEESRLEAEVTEYKNLIRALVSKNYEVMLFHQGIGETCVFSMLAHAYKRKIKKPLIIMALQESRKQILKACPDIDDVVLCSPKIYAKIREDKELMESCGIKDFLSLHAVVREWLDIKTKVCRFLDIPLDTAYVRYPMKCDDPQRVRRYFESKNLKTGNTVFIVPTAVSYGAHVVSDEYWQKLADKIRESGREVFFNSDRAVADGTDFGFLDMQDVAEFVTLCGNVVGVRTGLLDYIATFTDVPIQAIYPNETCSCWKEVPEFRDSTQPLEEIMEKHFAIAEMKNMLGAEHVTQFIHHDEEEEIEAIVSRLRA